MSERFDIAVIGGGPGGYVAAIRAAQLGAKVAVVEKARMGGTCLNVGCIPSKALVKSVQVLESARKAARFGIELDVASIQPNMEKIMARKDQVVNQMVSSLEGLMKAYKIQVFNGHGTFVRPDMLMVKTELPEAVQVEAANMVIATGSSIARLPIPGTDLPGVIDSDRILNLKHIPKSMVIIGGGIIGIEWAGIMAPLGTKVTIVEALPSILAPVDEEITKRFLTLFKKQKVDVYTGAKVEAIEQNGSAKDISEQLTVRYATDKGPQSVNAELVMVAVGRVPYTEGLGLEDIGILKDRRSIVSNSRMETNVPHIYAIGDVTQRVMLAHVASAEGEVAVENIMGHSRLMDYRAVPNCIFSNPEIAMVGPTEQELQSKKIPYRVSKFPFSALGRAVTIDETQGLVKLLVSDTPKAELLGAHIMGPDATDIIAELTLAIQEKLPVAELAHTIHAHPTLPEAIQEAALNALPGASAIHFKKTIL
jgi:dihydrolipoamide dehydrogenase